MAKLSNSPKQALNFDLERRKSFTFRVRLKYSDGSLVNLTGCTLRFVMKSAGAVGAAPAVSTLAWEGATTALLSAGV